MYPEGIITYTAFCPLYFSLECILDIFPAQDKVPAYGCVHSCLHPLSLDTSGVSLLCLLQSYTEYHVNRPCVFTLA